ncbi:MAG TPA: ATP-grasp domain-containing protein, partial [Planctomycetaceae bacterium]|nr:ATP-grasp domain-containing protein [Planctomycetaceae bacterium]
MRVFVSEFVCGGAWSGPLDSSLASEGRAMLLAIADDLARGEDVAPVVTWDERLGPFPLPDVDVRTVASPSDEEALFCQLVAQSDAAFVIAPELDAALAERRRRVAELGGRFLGADLEAIQLCSDKLATYHWLQQHEFPTVPTHRLSSEDAPPRTAFPIVLKRRDGAGSCGMRLVTEAVDWASALPEALKACPADQLVWQPLVPGQAVSCLALVSLDRQRIEVFPPAEQRLSNDGRFCYRGGRVPAELPDATREFIGQTVRRVCEDLSGLRGFVGFDWIVPHEAPSQPVIVDVNPRLTTSYIGYRALARENLALRLLAAFPHLEPIRWSESTVAFRPDGTVAV